MKRKTGGRSRVGKGSRKRRRIVSRRSAMRTVSRTQVYPFRRFVSGKVSIVGNDTLPTLYGGVSFTLSDTPAFAEFTQLFDQYKIAGVAYRFCLNKDPMVATNKAYPRLTWVHDYDDSNAPTALTDLAQYPGMKEHWFGDSRQTTRWYFMRPARAAVEYEGTTNSSYRPQWKGFIDCASSTAPHYGIKYGVDQLFAGMNVYLQCRYYLVFKNVR